MFSGIIEQRIEILDRKETGGLLSFVFRSPQGAIPKDGESVLLNGICSTVTNARNKRFTIDYMPETRQKTTVDDWKVGDAIHFEPSLRVGDQLGGHFMFGHIDAVGTVQDVRRSGDAVDVFIKIPKTFSALLISKGSVAIDGASLTVVTAGKDHFSVSLIPHTLELTHFDALRKGSTVNVEFDMLAKYVQNILAR